MLTRVIMARTKRPRIGFWNSKVNNPCENSEQFPPVVVDLLLLLPPFDSRMSVRFFPRFLTQFEGKKRPSIFLLIPFPREKINARFTHPSSFHKVGDHDDGPHALLPDHSPEGVERVRQRALSGDVGPGLLEPVNVIGIDVLAAFLTRKGPQLDARVVIWRVQRIKWCSVDAKCV